MFELSALRAADLKIVEALSRRAKAAGKDIKEIVWEIAGVRLIKRPRGAKSTQRSPLSIFQKISRYLSPDQTKETRSRILNDIRAAYYPPSKAAYFLETLDYFSSHPIYEREANGFKSDHEAKKLVAELEPQESWTWTPESADVGNSTIEVQIRDGLHAKEGSYDANTSVSYTISSNSAPTISSVYVNEYGNPFVGEEIVVVCEASDTNGDQIYYKFFIYRESVGAAREELTGWQTENSVKVKLDKTDYGGISVYAQVRDKYHAGEGGYDAEDSVFIDVQRAEISSVTFSLASPKAHETTIEVVCTANKSSGLFYRFWLKGPGTGNVWKDMTGWIEKNSWQWRTLACDIGTNYIRAEVTDTKAGWSDSDTTGRRVDSTYVIS